MALRLGALAVAVLAVGGTAAGQDVAADITINDEVAGAALQGVAATGGSQNGDQQYMDYSKYIQEGQGGQGGAGGYQQYMDYQKYMQGQGAGSSAGGATDYQQYMDYQKYMQGENLASSGTAAGKDVAADSTTNDKGDGAAMQRVATAGGTPNGYQQYMEYSKYTQGGQGGLGGQGGAGDYQQYMDYQKYMQGTGAGGAGGAANYQQYMDYQKYMQGQGAGSSAGGAADYQQYMDYQKYMQGMNFASSGTAAGKDAAADSTTNDKVDGAEMQGGATTGGTPNGYQQYMDYSKYIQGGQGGQGGAGGYQQYMDYQKYMQGQGGQGTQGGGAADYTQYMDYQKYMQGQGGTAGGQGGASDFSQYMDYQKYIDLSATSSVPASAAACNSTAQLKEWRDHQKASIEKYIPQAYRHFAEAPIDKEYEKNLDRLTGKIPPPSPPASAENCTSVEQLKAWRKAREEPIKSFVPAAYRGMPLKNIEEEYTKNLARIDAHAAGKEKKAEKEQEEHIADTHDKKHEDATVPHHGDSQKAQRDKKAEREEQTIAAKPEASESLGDKIEKAFGYEESDKSEVDHESKDPDHDEQAPPADVRLATSGSSIGFTSRLARVMWVLPVAVAGAFAAVALSRRGRRDSDDESVGSPFLLLDTVA